MDTNAMRQVDGAIGPFACRLLTVVRRCTDPFRAEPPSDPRRIVIFKLAEQGATVAASTALRRAVEMVGASNVFVVVFSQNRFVLDELQIVPPANVLTISTDARKFPAHTLRVIRRLRAERVDAAVDFEFFARLSATLVYLSGATRRVGLHSYFGEGAYRGDLMTHRIAANPHLHAADHFRVMVEALRVDPEVLPTLPLDAVVTESSPKIEVSADETARMRVLLREAFGDVVPKRLMLLNANAGDLLPVRRWPSDRYVDLAQRLVESDPDLHVAFTGAPGEASDAEALARRVGSSRVVSVAGRTSMRELLVLYSEADLLVTNDSGPAHYATLTDIDVITLFGPETPVVFGARDPRSHHVRAPIPCSPCVSALNDRQTACTDNQCMQRISVDQVAQLCAVVLDRRRVVAA